MVEPEIPQNTGNIARTCAVTGTKLHLVRPLGFSTEDRYLKRAGLDYWHLVDITYHDSLQEFLAHCSGERLWFFSTRGKRWYTEVNFQPNDYLVFGPETRGLPADLLAAYPNQCLRIPMREGVRSLNLSSSVAIVLYEALRQLGFPGLV